MRVMRGYTCFKSRSSIQPMHGPHQPSASSVRAAIRMTAPPRIQRRRDKCKQFVKECLDYKTSIIIIPQVWDGTIRALHSSDPLFLMWRVAIIQNSYRRCKSVLYTTLSKDKKNCDDEKQILTDLRDWPILSSSSSCYGTGTIPYHTIHTKSSSFSVVACGSSLCPNTCTREG
eukprot:scaffold5533_cov159-Amphora_coffeaeformis.AAC.4